MKKVLLSTAALAGLALVAAAPARAAEPALQLSVGGYITGYAVYTDQDEPTGTDYRSFDFRKDSEVHLDGEVALDNGITAGAHLEIMSDRSDNSSLEESNMFVYGDWGRINMGEEDGVAYLMQVLPPSVDANIAGARPIIGSFADAMDGITDGNGHLTYSQLPFGNTTKFSYITPMFSGFQAGFTFIPSIDEGDLAGTAVAQRNDTANEYENGWELAARYNANVDALELTFGGAYSGASLETSSATMESLKVWNLGVDAQYEDLGFGVAYMVNNNGFKNNGDTKTWIAGVDYAMGAYTLGVNYVNEKIEDGAVAGTEDVKVDRWTVGGIYEWGPGMTFRGAVQFQSADNVDGSSAATADVDGTQITIGTQLNF